MKRENTERATYGLIKSVDDLETIKEQLAQQFPGNLLLFRGQSRNYPTVRSGLARPDIRFDPDVEQGWSVLAGCLLGDEGLTPTSKPFRKAVLQHYGLSTHYVDVTSDIKIAAWFAINEYQECIAIWGGNPLRRIKQIRYAKREQGTGVIVVMAIPNSQQLQQSRRVFDLSNLQFVRPQRQKAWLLYDRQPLLPDPNDFWVATIEVDCQHLSLPFTTEYLFPPPHDDPGYARLLNYPFIQLPSFLLSDASEKGHVEGECHMEKPGEIPRPDFAMRAIAVPDYVNNYGDGNFNHKWNDRTLFEPEAMQSWVRWRFPLEESYPGIRGNIGEATKLTISPEALQTLYQQDRPLPLRWPDLGNNDLLFTFSQYAYDKVDDITFPFEGVWLHKDHDLILEHQITADMDVMNVHAGHAYEFVGGHLVREDISISCVCGEPERHDVRVRAMLRLSTLLEMEQIILVPHPIRFPRWYLVL